jgi:hypothetical protein
MIWWWLLAHRAHHQRPRCHPRDGAGSPREFRTKF